MNCMSIMNLKKLLGGKYGKIKIKSSIWVYQASKKLIIFLKKDVFMMEKRILKWVEDGLIDKQTALKMLADIKEEKQRNAKIKTNITIYTIAVILLGIGVISFIAANDWIIELLNSSNILKIALMSAVTFSSLWFGYQLAYEKKNFPRLGNALIVLSSILIGATYALIGQTYNINANNSCLMFIWLISIVPLAYLFKNHTINIISIVLLVLGVIFFYAQLAIDESMVWTIFMPVICGTLLYSIGNIPFVLNKFNNFSLSYKIVGSLPIFITLLILTCFVENSYNITSPYYTVLPLVLISANLINYVNQKNSTKLLKTETIAISIILALLWLILVLPNVFEPLVIVLANLSIIAMIAFGFNYGYKFESDRIISITNFMLTIYLIVNYCRWGWSFIDKTLFFILGGSLLLALGLYLEKRKKGIVKKEK